MKPVGIVTVLWSCFFIFATSEADDQVSVKGPLSAGDSLKHMRVAPGLRVDLIASEPQVIDPVAIAFDENGNMWVVEMTDYPNGPVGGQPPRSRVRVLEDRNGDGVFETARTFVDHLLYATGLQLWQGGAFITLAGKVIYCRDTTGDGKADLKETWFTGFAEENQQLRANHPTLGMDNRIYIANGLRGGIILGRSGPNRPAAVAVSITGSDFRFDPQSGYYDAVTGAGQFGLAFDDFGNRFVCTNRNATKHIVFNRRYIERNNHFIIPNGTHDVSPPGPNAVVYPLSRNWTHYSDHAGQITAACGVLVNRDQGLGDDYRGNVFVCEPPGNLVHRRILIPDGVTFRSERARDGVEFLASPDDWFRPVNLTLGPDGSLYVVDMYRAVIEHPHWLPEDLAEKLPLNAGNDRGRIYRISKSESSIQSDSETRSSTGGHQLANRSSGQLVSILEHSNSWWRDTAARLLYERQDTSIVEPLETLAVKGSRAVSRIHAIWTLDGLGKLTKQHVLTALSDSNPSVREHAVRLSERYLETWSELVSRLIQLARDPDMRVRWQVALSLGQVSCKSTIMDALLTIALHSEADSWTRSAVLSAVGNHSVTMLQHTLWREGIREGESGGGRIELALELAKMIGRTGDMRATEEIMLSVIANGDKDPENHLASLMLVTEMATGVSEGQGDFSLVLDKLLSQSDDRGIQLDRFMENIIDYAKDLETSPEIRRACFRFLGLIGFDRGGRVLLEVASSDPSLELRGLAIEQLSGYRSVEIAPVLLKEFASQTPVIRGVVLNAMLAVPERCKVLLTAFSNKKIALSELNPSVVQRLVEHPEESIRQRAQQLLSEVIPESRQKVLREYSDALSVEGDPMLGRQIFQNNCTDCHRIGTIGVEVGPYIGDFPLKPNVRTNPKMILESILNPNRAIDANYVSYTVVTNRGQVHTGIVAQDTAGAVTLRQAKDKTVTVFRRDIDEIRSNRISLMPEGFEQKISVEQMSDLIAFLRDWRFLDGMVPLALEDR